MMNKRSVTIFCSIALIVGGAAVTWQAVAKEPAPTGRRYTPPPGPDHLGAILAPYRPLERRMIAACGDGRYEECLQLVDEHEAYLAAHGVKDSLHPRYRQASYAALGMHDKVVDSYDRTPRDPMSITTLGISLVKQGKLEEAASLYDPEILLRDSSVEPSALPGTATGPQLEASFRFTRARLLMGRLDGMDAAIEELEKADRLAPKTPALAYELARLYHAKEEYAKALPHYQTASQLPGHQGEEAKRRYDWIKDLAAHGRIQL